MILNDKYSLLIYRLLIIFYEIIGYFLSFNSIILSINIQYVSTACDGEIRYLFI